MVQSRSFYSTTALAVWQLGAEYHFRSRSHQLGYRTAKNVCHRRGASSASARGFPGCLQPFQPGCAVGHYSGHARWGPAECYSRKNLRRQRQSRHSTRIEVYVLEEPMALVTCTRREFFFQISAAAMLPWSSPVLDIHVHIDYSGRTNEQLLIHCDALGVKKGVLLPAEGSMRENPERSGNEACVKLMSAHPDRFVRFSSADLKQPRPIDRIRKFLDNGGIGIGEQKYPVACDGPEMRAVYELA